MRLFAALVPPPEAVEHLDEFLAPRRAAEDFRWTSAEQFHLTLAFVGRAEEWRADAYVDALAEAVAPVPAVRLRLGGAVAFPDAGRAKVLAAGVMGERVDTVLPRLARRTRTAAVRCGLEVDGQRFRPHLTLARMRRSVDVSNWVKLLDTYVGPEWTADRVEVMVSHLGQGSRGRPRHESLATVHLEY